MRLTSDDKSTRPSYVSFRDNFLNLLKSAGLNHHRQIIPGLGWQNESLSQDFAVYNCGAPTTLVHLSGVHGVEGYVGSCIQETILKNMANDFQDQKINVVFVHAVNPYGMSWYRRVNADNVDLNRNGLVGQAPNIEAPQNSDVFAFLSFLESRTHLELWKQMPQLFSKIRKFGFARAAQAIAGGQWQYPNVIFYGGQEIQPEVRLLPKILIDLVPTTKKFVVIDVHSGLGPRGHDSLLVADHNQMDFFLLATAEASKSHVVDTSPSSKVPLYRSRCALEDFLRQEWSHYEFAYLTQEFGTLFFGQVLATLILENSRFHENPLDPERPELSLKSFFPSDLKWQATCRQAGLARFTQILRAL